MGYSLVHAKNYHCMVQFLFHNVNVAKYLSVQKIIVKIIWLSVVQGKEVIEYYINELLTEGIYHVPTWAESCASASVVDETASLAACTAIAAANPSSSVTASLSGPGLLRVASTLQLGASASNIAIDSEGTEMIHLSMVLFGHNNNNKSSPK